MARLNIRIEDLKRAKTGLDSKQIKARKELLALAMWFKVQHSNGAILKVTKAYLRKNAGIGNDKAERLILQMKESDLFTIIRQSDGTYRVWVGSFRDKLTKRKKSRKGRTYRADEVCLFEFEKDCKLKDIYNAINDRLMLLPISAASRKESLRKGEEESSSSSVANPVQVTTKAFAKTIGMGVGSVSRIKKRLVGTGVITSTYAERHSADLRNEVEAKRLLQRLGKRDFTYTYGDFGYVLIPCSYSIVAHNGATFFYHKFTNYKSINMVRNLKANRSKKKPYAFMQID